MIDRKALVERHHVVQTSLDSRSPVSVGNGEFAFTVDVTGLQSMPTEYPVGPRDASAAPGTLLGTQAQWGWHSIPTDTDYSLEDSVVTYQSPTGPVPYVDMKGSITDGTENAVPPGELWLRANPHRLDLGRLGFSLPDNGSQSDASPTDIRPLRPDDIANTHQTLALWTGVVHSSFTLGTDQVTVTTACHPDRDELGIHVESAALTRGLGVTLAFPYGSGEWHNAADWEASDAHRTTLKHDDDGWLVSRELDASGYQVRIAGSGLQVEQRGRHELQLTTDSELLDFTVHFISTGQGDCTVRSISPKQEGATEARGAAAVVVASSLHWQRFWTEGGALELHKTDDPRAREIERRVVLSRYLTAVNCAGSMPPQETGLVCNSWRGKFHLEMHWWHSAHFPLWGRPDLLLRSLRWYHDALEGARQTAKWQGYDGARWPKQVGPDGRETPSSIGTFLIWQQPHPIYLAELLHRANPSQQLLEEFAEVVFESASFMASFAHDGGRGFELGPPLVPAQESYGSIRARATNPTFELAYWQWALRIASQWRSRLKLEPVEQWETVAANMVKPHVREGVYSAIDVEPFTIRNDHPSMLCALGFLPQTELVDMDVMRATLAEVRADWNWESTWGWDYPVLAMAAARLGEPETAVDSLLLGAGKNSALANGHNRQTDSLPLYLPGNGGLLAAVAMMAAGWDDGPTRNAPGFPKEWTVEWEGLVRAP